MSQCESRDKFSLPQRERANFSPFSRAGLRWAFFTTEIVPHWAQSWLRPDNAPTVEYDGGPMGERL